MNYGQTDVIFAIEKSITLRRYLDELLEDYIIPALSYFSRGIHEEREFFLSKTSPVQYALVFFGSELSVVGGSSQLETEGPTTSQTSIINAIKDANYCYRNTCREAYIFEALQTATEVFKSLSGGNIIKDSTQRCLVLITQSVPIENPWAASSPENIVKELKRIGVKTSIISAHKMVELYRLFENTGGDRQSITVKNFVTKPQHLVLLNGVTLQERTVNTGDSRSSVTHTDIPVNCISSAATVPSPITVQNSRPTPSPVLMFTNSIASQQTQSNQPIITKPVAVKLVPSHSMPVQARIPDGGIVRPARQISTQANATMNTTISNGWSVGGNASTMVQNFPKNVQMVQGKINLQQNLQMVQGNHPQQIQMSAGETTMPQTVRMSTGGNSQQVPQLTTQIGESLTLWRGILEWTERSPQTGESISQRIPCNISQPIAGSASSELKSDGWPLVLQMMLIQKSILGSVKNNFLQPVYKTIFLFDSSPALDDLTAAFLRGYAGCIHFGGNNNTDIKIIILLFSPEKKAFIGFIPVDQTTFAAKIRQLFQSHARSLRQTSNVNENIDQTINPQTGISSQQNIQAVSNSSGMVDVSHSKILMDQNRMQPTVDQNNMNNAGNVQSSSSRASQVEVGHFNQLGSNTGQRVNLIQNTNQRVTLGSNTSQVINMGSNASQSINIGSNTSQGHNMGSITSQGINVGSQPHYVLTGTRLVQGSAQNSQIKPNATIMGNKIIRHINITRQQPQQQNSDQMQLNQSMSNSNIRLQYPFQQQRPAVSVNLQQPTRTASQVRLIMQQQNRLQQQQQQVLIMQQQQQHQQQNIRPQLNQNMQNMGQNISQGGRHALQNNSNDYM